MSGVLRSAAGPCRQVLTGPLKRHFGASAQLLAQDPIQKLYLDKLNEFKQSADKGKPLGYTTEVENRYKDMVERVTTQFGAHKEDFSKFPTFNFEDEKLEPIGLDDIQFNE